MTPDLITDTLYWGVFFGGVAIAMEVIGNFTDMDDLVRLVAMVSYCGLLVLLAPAPALIALIVYLSAVKYVKA